LKEFYLVTPTYDGARATYLKFEEGAMPKLEKLDVPFFVSAAKEYGVNLGINHLPCLKHVVVRLENEHATYSESQAAAAAIRNEANTHPNHPRVFIDGEMEEDPEETDTNEEES
jgi:disease resistance protein RPM1